MSLLDLVTFPPYERRIAPVRADALVTIERKVLVDGANGRRAFAHRGRDSFGRSGTDIADRKQSGTAGFERQRGASECLPRSVEMLAPYRSIRQHEAPIIEGR